MALLKSIFFAALTATTALAAGPSGPPPTYENSEVVDLMPSNFDKFALSGKPALVEFFAPWCGHCKTLAPVYEQLAQEFAFAKKDKLTIAKVDADREKELGKRFGIQGFPTIKYFDGKSEKPEEYTGGRDLESLTEFLKGKIGVGPRKKVAEPSQVEILTDKTFDGKIGGDQVVLVAFTAPWCGHCKTLAPIWEKVAKDFANEAGVIVAKVDAEGEESKAISKDVSSYPTIKFYPKGSKEPEAYSGGRTEPDLVNFLNEKAGTHRAPGGRLNASGGTIAALDAIVSKFTGGTSLTEAATEASAAATELKAQIQYKYAEYYVKVFDKLSKSDNYAAKELARLDKILQRGGLAPEKQDEFISKTNILKKFVEKVTGSKEEL